MVLQYITWALLTQHVPSATSQLSQHVLTHSPCLQLRLWGPPQVCCGFGAARQLGWCVSPVTLPERVLVVLCGQEKPQLFISSEVCFTLWATVLFCTYTSWGERGTLTGRGSLHIHPLWAQESAELGTAARATRSFTNGFKSCEEQVLPISTQLPHWILNQGLIFFTLTVLLHQSNLLSKLLIFSFHISLPALCCGCSLADECLRWGECWLACGEVAWVRSLMWGSRQQHMLQGLCCRTAKGNEQLAKQTEKGIRRRGRLSYSFFSVY